MFSQLRLVDDTSATMQIDPVEVPVFSGTSSCVAGRDFHCPSIDTSIMHNTEPKTGDSRRLMDHADPRLEKPAPIYLKIGEGETERERSYF